jgi:hypothetical protein
MNLEHTVRLSTVDPTNSIDLYVAPDTDISPIICKNITKDEISELK